MAPPSKDDARRQAAVLMAIHAFRRTLTEFQRRLGTAMKGEVSMADVFVLQYLAHAGDATPSMIASFTGLTSGSVSTMLDRLEAAGYVARKRGAKDRRQVLVQLVPGARQELMASMLQAHHEVGQMFDGWSTADIEALVGLLERIGSAPPHSKAKAPRRRRP
jgi:DNA-binding MarR family transcriptional regulator